MDISNKTAQAVLLLLVDVYFVMLRRID